MTLKCTVIHSSWTCTLNQRLPSINELPHIRFLTVYLKSCSWVPWFSTETFDILTQSPSLLSYFHKSVVMRIIMINLYLWTNGVNLMRVKRGWSYFACSKAYKEIRQANDWYLERRILIVILLEIAIIMLTNFLNHMTSLKVFVQVS